MSCSKRALLYVYKNKISTIIIVLILITFFAFLIIGSAMISSATKEIDNVTNTLCNSFNMTVVIDRDDPSLWTEEVVEKDGTTIPAYHSPVSLTDSMAERILKVDGIRDYNAEIADSMHTSLRVKEGFFANDYERLLNDPEYYEATDTTDDDLVFIEQERQSLNITVNTSSEKHELFRNGALEIAEGRHLLPDDRFKALVSEDFAQRNHLNIGDMVPIDISQELIDAIYFDLNWIKPIDVKLEVVGIYHINFQIEESDYTAETEMPENFIFINALTYKEIEELKGFIPTVNKELKYYKLTFFVDDPDEIDSVIDRMKHLEGTNWDYVDIVKDDTNFKPLKDSLEGIKNIGLLMVIGAGIGCFAVVVLLIMMRTKRRSREAGILLSLGISKKQINAQMIFEIFITGAIALIVAVIISGMLIQPLGNAVNDSFSKVDSEGYDAYYDAYSMSIVAKRENADVDLDYDFTSGLISATVGFSLLFIPVSISARKLLKKKPYNLLLDYL